MNTYEKIIPSTISRNNNGHLMDRWNYIVNAFVEIHFREFAPTWYLPELCLGIKLRNTPLNDCTLRYLNKHTVCHIIYYTLRNKVPKCIKKYFIAITQMVFLICVIKLGVQMQENA